MNEDIRPITLSKLEFRQNFIVWTNSLAMIYVVLLVSSVFMPPALMIVLIPKYFILGCKIASGIATVIAYMFYLLTTTRLILEGESKTLHLVSCILFVLVALMFGYFGFLM
jgi:hypothetical protein